MILICGIPSETPIAMVRSELEKLGIPYVMFNQRKFAQMTFSFTLEGGVIKGVFTVDGHSYPLEDFRSVYTRTIDIRHLPELATAHPDSPAYLQARNLHDTLFHWCEIAPIRVMNRIEAMGSNFSKPYQSQLVAEHGLLSPPTLITNNPEAVYAFCRQYNRVIYKSISGVRSIVHTATESDLKRLDLIRWCPTQFQAFIEGTNVRVHIVGNQLFATAINSLATDYRYAHQQTGYPAQLSAIDLSPELSERCIQLTQALGLEFAGIDLKISPTGDVYCFEVNPSPAYSYYELHTGQAIAKAVAKHLAKL
ncbi:MAG: hypothetical protein AAF614_41095 [Chloroflexota bacterium]